MVIAFVVRLLAEHLVDGVFAGEVQVVATGERTVVRNADDLLTVLRHGTTTSAGVPLHRMTEEER